MSVDNYPPTAMASTSNNQHQSEAPPTETPTLTTSPTTSPQRLPQRNARSFAKATSLGQRLVGPLKSYITSSVNHGNRCLGNVTQHLTKYFHADSVSPITETSLNNAEYILRKGEAYIDRLEKLNQYTQEKYKDVEFQESPEKERFQREVAQLLVDIKPEVVLVNLKMEVHKLRTALEQANRVLSPKNTSGYVFSDFNTGPFSSDSEAEQTVRNQHKSPTPPATAPGATANTSATSTPDLSTISSEANAHLNSEYPHTDSLASELVRTTEQFKALERRNEELRCIADLDKQTIAHLQDRCTAQQQEKEESIRQGEREREEYRKYIKERTKDERIAEMKRESAATAIPNMVTEPQHQPPIMVTQPHPCSNYEANQWRAQRPEEVESDAAMIARMFASSQDRMTADISKVLGEQTATLKAIALQVKHNSDRLDDKELNGDEAEYDAACALEQRAQEATNQKPKEAEVEKLLEQRSTHRMNYKMAMEYLISFNGSQNSNFSQFYSMFNSTVMNNKDIGDETKLAILISKLEGDARKCIAEISEPSLAIETTLECLETVYGKSDTKRSLLQKFKALPFHPSDPKQMKLDLMSHKNLAYKLCIQGLGKDDDRITIEILDKLPHIMRTRVSEHYSRLSAKGNVTAVLMYQYISELIDGWQVEIENSTHHGAYRNNNTMHELRTPRAAIALHGNAYAGPTPQNGQYNQNLGGNSNNYTPAPYNSQKQPGGQGSRISLPKVYDAQLFKEQFKDPITGSMLPGYYRPGEGVQLDIIHRTFPLNDETSKFPCTLCKGSHNPLRCGLTSWEFRNAIEMTRRCPICTFKHRIENCTSQFKCAYCSGLHHTGGCPRKEHYRDVKNYPEGARPILQFFCDLFKPKGSQSKTNSTNSQ